MPTSKSKTKTRKENKLRPYRVDYFLHDEMLLDKALVRSVVIRAVTADVAKSKVGDASLSAGRPGDNFTVIRAYRFYKKLTAEPIRKTYIAIDKLLSVKRAIEVMTEIENRKVPVVIRPEDLPYTNPNHVCTDKCIDFVEINPTNEYSADSIEVLRGMGKSAPNAIETAPNTIETAPNAIDPPDASVTIEREGQPTETSSGAAEGWADSFDLDEAAPIIHPCSDEYSDLVGTTLPRLVLEEGLGLKSELVLNVPKKKKSSAVPILLTTLAVIGALVYVYFHYFAK